MRAGSAVLSIAGYDPSGGAGVLADVKVFEQIGVMGMAVTTAITYQNDIEFEGCEWLGFDKICRQIEVLNRRFDFDYVKIGLIENLDILSRLIDFLRYKNNNTKIIWDPILRTSSGFNIHGLFDQASLSNILARIYLITPNIPEAARLYEADFLASHTDVILKGGHSQSGNCNDMLYEGGEKSIIAGPKLENVEKHGSGCVYSAALTAYLSKGLTLNEAAIQAKEYVSAYLKSSDTLLGFHSVIGKRENVTVD